MYTWAEEPIQVTKERERSDLFNSSKVKCGLDRIDLSFGKVGSNFSYTSFIINRIKMSHVYKVSPRHVVYCTPFPQTWLLYVCAYQKFHKWPENKDYNQHKKVVVSRLRQNFSVVCQYPETIPETARSKAWVCCRSFAGIVGSNPAGVVDVCLFWVLCVDR